MKASFSIKLVDGRSYVQALKEAALKANKAAADDFVRLVTDNIRSGRAPDGSGQKSNDPKTARAKRRKLGHATPLVNDRVLSNPGLWRVSVTGGTVVVSPPAERTDTLYHLARHGYKTSGIPGEFNAIHKARLAHELSETLPGIRFTTIKGGG